MIYLCIRHALCVGQIPAPMNNSLYDDHTNGEIIMIYKPVIISYLFNI